MGCVSDTDLAYLAGIIDGEGSVIYTSEREFSKRDNKWRMRTRWKVIIGNTELSIIEACEAVYFGLGIVFTRNAHMPSAKFHRRKLFHVLCVHRLPEVLKLVTAVEPYLRHKEKLSTARRMIVELPTRQYQHHKPMNGVTQWAA